MFVAGAWGAACALGHAQVTLTQNSSTNWTMTNGALTVVFDPSAENITSIQLGVGSGASQNLLNPSGGELDEEIAGTPFGSGPQTFNYQLGPDNSYVDVWTTVASTGTTVNPITYAFHYVLFANDPTIQVYETLSHSATDPATSVGQGQFLFRANPSLFPDLYQVNTGPNNLSAQTTSPVPSTNPNFSSVTNEYTGSGTTKDYYRTVQNVTYDLTGSGIPGDNGTNFFTKYDYSVYNQFYQAETMYGSQYAVSAIIPSMETLTGGPTKQELAWTDPDILNLEFLSDHYGIDGSGSGAYPGYAYYPTQGVASTRLFGAYAFQISSTTDETAAQINQDAINSIPTIEAEDSTDAELIASGYVPMNTNQRGSLQLTAGNSAGWSSDTNNNTVVLSEPGVNMQESTQGDQYWGQISQNGTATISNVVPGTYRMTLYELGQWGETRIDGVQVQGGQVTVPQNVKFTPENFSSYAPIWTIGTPNRSSNEFMNGHTASGADQRQYFGAYDFWAEEAALGTPGYVSYNATATVINGVAQAATNNPNAWIANQWYTFDPGLYDSGNDTDDNYNNTAPAYVTAGGGPANYHGAPWQVHFTTTSAQDAQGQYVVLSVGLVSQGASLVVALNGHSETWSYNNFSPDDPMIRSGDAGFYQWAAFQFPTSDLSAVGTDNEFTFSVSAHTDGVMYDALRMEITNTSASPTVTGWHDYTYISGSSQTAQNDALSIATLTWDNAGGTGNGVNWDNATNQNWSTGVAESTFSTGANVVFNDNNNGHYNVTLNPTVTPNSVLFNNSAGNYVVSGTGAIIGNGTLAMTGSGTVTLDTANSYTGGTNVSAGTLIAAVSGALPNHEGLVNNATTNIYGNETLGASGVTALTGTGTLNIGNGTANVVQLAIGSGAATQGGLTIAANSALDIGDNHLILSDPGRTIDSTIVEYLAAGYNGGAWNGTSSTSGAIITSATTGFSYGIGYADGGDGGISGVGSGQFEIAYALYGDTNLDGVVNSIDFGNLAANFGQSAKTWDQGDFDYDGTVNSIDFGLLAGNFGKSVGSNADVVSAADWAALDAFAAANGLMADVPEPVSAALMGCAAVGFLARRRFPRRLV
ncbi:MAG TPA: polysaccharide lyase family protein [Tepidisphaeraceae bacterium]|nr:polysaccharide lyase family protein [Tepidisphaeraceae bacterium]